MRDSSRSNFRFAFLLLLSACSFQPPGTTPGGGSGSSGSTKPCSVDVIRSYTALKIENGQVVSFDSKALELIGRDDFQVTSLKLKLTYPKKPVFNSNVSLGLNGFELSRPDGRRGFDDDKSPSTPTAEIQLVNMKLGGGLLAQIFLGSIKANGGVLKLSVGNSSLKIVSASLELRGYFLKDCPATTPTPQPTPAPTPPTVRLESVFPTENPTAQKTIQFAFASDQTNATFTCALDSEAEKICQSPMIYSGLGGGDHRFTVNAVSSQGLKSTQAAQYSWKVDAEASAVKFEPIPALTRAASIQIRFSAAETGQFYCSLDGAKVEECTSPKSYVGVNEGIHQIAVFLIDTVGNRGDIATVAWRTDFTPPMTQILSRTPAGAKTNAVAREFSFSADESATFECAIDGGVYAPCASPVKLSGLNEGGHRFDVHATDAAGNLGIAATDLWTIDLTPPIVSISSVQPASGKTNAADYAVFASSSEAGSLLCQIDGGEERVCLSPLSGTFNTDGTHEVRIRGVDDAGNRGDAQIVSWNLNRQIPGLSFANFDPSAAAALNQDHFAVDLVAQTSVQLTVTLNDQALSLQGTRVVLNALPEGHYELIARGRDEFGNVSADLRHSFDVDLTAPDVSLSSLIPPDQVTNQRANILTLTSTDAAAKFQCQLDGAGFAACDSPVSLSGLADGSHKFEVRSMDAAGNVSAITNTVWNIDATAPETTASYEQPSASLFRLTFGANEPGVSFACSTDGASERTCYSPLTLNLPEGEHTVLVHAIDSAGNRDAVGASLKLTSYAAVTTTITASHVDDWTNQRTATFEFRANFDDATFLCQLDGADPRPCRSPYRLTNLADGPHTVRIQSVDRFGATDPVGAARSWTIDTVSPVITSQSTATTSTTITVTWQTSEVSSHAVDWGAGTDLSSTLSADDMVTTHTLQISNLTPATLYSIQIRGKDRAGNPYSSQKFQIRTRF